MWNKINFIFDKKQKRNLLILFFMIVLGSILELLGVSAVLPLVKLVSSPEIITENEYFLKVGELLNLTSVKSYIMIMALLMIFVYVIKNLYLLFMYDVQYRFTYNNQRRIATKLMKSYMSQEYLYHLSNSSAKLMRNINIDVPQFFSTVLNLLQLMTELLTCSALVIFLAVQDFFTTLSLTVIIFAFLFVFYVIYKSKSFRLGQQNREYSAKLNQCMLQSFHGIKENKIFNKEQYFLNQYDQSYEIYSSTARKQNLLGIIPKPIIESVCICGLLSVLTIRISIGGNMESFIPMLSVFAVAAFRMLPSFNRITSYMNTIQFNKPSVDAVYEDLKEIEVLLEKYNADQKSSLKIQLSNELKINDISFQYPETDKRILDHVTFNIPKFSSVALIGTSGAGKTTLADIIMGLLPPQTGEIMVDDINIYQNLHAWHKVLGYIPQTIYLLDDTIVSNIAYGEAIIDEERLWMAIKEAQLEDFIDQLPNGVETMVGERGVRLSGGQRQRIGIARALYRNPSILILDEATSALDNETETAVMDAIHRLQGKKTLLIIAHRLTTIRNCNIIYEVKDGKVLLKNKSDIM